jgi:septin family protein
MPAMTGHIPQHYEYDSTLQIGFDDLQGFSPVTQGLNAYRTPYPDSNATSTSSATSPERTNASLLNDPIVFEAEEDKRKRNQAASARFRQKKKQREQQLMETSQKMQDRTKKLEAENDELKKENMFLKKLLVEKVDHMSDDDRELLKKAAEGALAGAIGRKS